MARIVRKPHVTYENAMRVCCHSGSGKTRLASDVETSPTTCTESGDGIVKTISIGKTVEIWQRWDCALNSSTTVTVQVVDRFASSSRSVKVDTTITPVDQSVPFTTRLSTALNFESNPERTAPSAFWIPFGKGCVQNAGAKHGMCLAGSAPWTSALAPEPLRPRKYRYGAVGELYAVDKADDTFSVPVATVLDNVTDSGISLALSPEDPMLEVVLAISPTGLRFDRHLLRIGQRPTQFSYHLVGHAGCWRPALNFMVAEFPGKVAVQKT